MFGSVSKPPGVSPKRILKIVFGVFALLGLLFAGIGVGVDAVQRQKMEACEPVDAVIVYIDRGNGAKGSKDTKVTFLADGTEHTVWLGYYDSSLAVGDHMTVYYDPANPRHAYVDHHLFLLVFGILGGVFFLIGATGFFVVVFRNKSKQKWKENGELLYASISGTGVDTSYRVNGRSPYRVYADYHDPETGERWKFQSEALWFDPYPYLAGPTVPVYVKPGNPRRYYMDVSHISGKAPV